VDRLRKQFHIRIENAIRDNPSRAPQLMSFDSVYKHLERLADMATNIAEDVIYMVEGDIVRHRVEQ
jgi:phosphate transport system protein